MSRLLLVVSSAATTLALAAPASAAVVSLDADGLQYRAAPLEANRVDMQTGLAPFYPFFEHGATLTAGPGCSGSQPVVCGDGHTFAAPQVYLGDRDDVAFVDSFFGSPRVFGEGGNDDIWSGGGTETFAYGGAGNDTLRLNTDGAGTGIGGSGDDRIGSNGSVQDNLQGEGGDDLLVSIAAGARLTGGSGGDDVVLLGTGQASGDGGADVLVAPERGILSAGAGNDIVKGHGTVDAGGGTDWVDVTDAEAGVAPDTVSCGPGIDVVWASADDVIGRDCELALRRPAPALPAVTAALAAAHDLQAHRPDPTQP